WSRRWGSFGFGASGFFLFGTSISQIELTAVASASRFATITLRTDEGVYGLVGAVGIRWDPGERVHLGLSAYSPEVGTGSRKQFARAAVADTSSGQPPAIAVINASDLTASPTLPLRVQGGVALNAGSFL